MYTCSCELSAFTGIPANQSDCRSEPTSRIPQFGLTLGAHAQRGLLNTIKLVPFFFRMANWELFMVF